MIAFCQSHECEIFCCLICIPILVRLNLRLLIINLSTVNYLSYPLHIFLFGCLPILLLLILTYIFIYLEVSSYPLDTNPLPVIWITYIFSPFAVRLSFYGIHNYAESFYFNTVKFITIFRQEKCCWCLKSYLSWGHRVFFFFKYLLFTIRGLNFPGFCMWYTLCFVFFLIQITTGVSSPPFHLKTRPVSY